MWICKECKSEVEDNFEVCWNCGNTEKDISVSTNDSSKHATEPEEYTETPKDNDDPFIDIKSLEATVKKRFFNCLIDTIVILLLAMGLDYFTGDNEIVLFLLPFIFFLYYLLFETFSGATIGKLITSTRVVNVYGDKPHFFTVFARTLCRFIPLDVFTFAAKGGGWHDNFTKTFVVYLGDNRNRPN